MADQQVNLAKQSGSHQMWAYPCVMDIRAEFLIDSLDDLILYPTQCNVSMFEIMGVFKRLKDQHFKDVSIGANLAYAPRSIFYGHNLIEHETTVKNKRLFGLNTFGRSAAASIAQGYVWSSRHGIRKDLTREYYARIMASDFSDVTVPATRFHYAPTRKQPTSVAFHLAWHDIEWIAQLEACNQCNFGKEFKQEVMLRKLQRG